MLETGRIVPIVLSDLLRQTRAPGEEGMLSPAGRRRPDPAAVPGWGWLEKPEGVRGLGMPGWHGAGEGGGGGGWVPPTRGNAPAPGDGCWGRRERELRLHPGGAEGLPTAPPRPRQPSSPHRPFRPLSGARSTPKFPVP